ncbi:type I-E CRISPR-associated protein Cse2/CasB [Kibdelosporangium phytohabitans]|uniref:CRISPR-associated protein Cse2 n=1 Tax=Kibdelosporangium phytohabitans TaxID=860235 RepID=A0A0N9HXX5_9PSEU|nr:type I-E CRISPR-associated protein Cse2/CasB [Kibdelosporangium phytohabitans]ALG06953.1 hypothetical protein AOZ06_08470 [Kibdelosporangium phytohabitans]MBE1468229.1 CRISPR system Cascade subunit CasB [Kibdelosporangium phytohabitans]
MRSALKSGLGRTVKQADGMHKYVAPWTSPGRPHHEAVLYTVAALIAHRPTGAIPAQPIGNIGVSVARCARIASGTRETTMHLLAKQPAAQLCRVVTRVVVQLRDKDTTVDFAQLIDDASSWPSHHQRISSRWLQSFYRTMTPQPYDATT